MLLERPTSCDVHRPQTNEPRQAQPSLLSLLQNARRMNSQEIVADALSETHIRHVAFHRNYDRLHVFPFSTFAPETPTMSLMLHMSFPGAIPVSVLYHVPHWRRTALYTLIFLYYSRRHVSSTDLFPIRPLFATDNLSIPIRDHLL
ncbi:hypothetical protein LshimejAT787_1701510 [Lyophyllum shimeji]|uniref:Uncharacterized protein n=1 Tax=Lyophyllum shimeji TaxID=47721 RepID=A0A9P3PZL7_LYOSH|nr:hypothetical protein LshimejAT787_1701510 [Lyophyllum shimeji]